jgi:hypothetical protein
MSTKTYTVRVPRGIGTKKNANAWREIGLVYCPYCPKQIAQRRFCSISMSRRIPFPVLAHAELMRSIQKEETCSGN